MTKTDLENGSPRMRGLRIRGLEFAGVGNRRNSESYRTAVAANFLTIANSNLRSLSLRLVE
jgi:hypothetical protein